MYVNKQTSFQTALKAKPHYPFIITLKRGTRKVVDERDFTTTGGMKGNQQNKSHHKSLLDYTFPYYPEQ